MEADPKEIRYWHLLGLLLTAQERWKEAAEILERGAELDKEASGELEDEDDEGGADSGEELLIAANQSSTIESPSLRPVKAKLFPACGTVYALGKTETTIPPASGLLRSMLEKNPPSKKDVYEYSLQLRMTQVALAEVVNGPEGAEEKWVDVFSWIAGKKGVSQSSECWSCPVSLSCDKLLIIVSRFPSTVARQWCSTKHDGQNIRNNTDSNTSPRRQHIRD